MFNRVPKRKSHSPEMLAKPGHVLGAEEDKKDRGDQDRFASTKSKQANQICSCGHTMHLRKLSRAPAPGNPEVKTRSVPNQHRAGASSYRHESDISLAIDNASLLGKLSVA